MSPYPPDPHALRTPERCDLPVRRVEVRPDDPFPYPEGFRRRVVVDVIHDGDTIPSRFLVDRSGDPIPAHLYRATYVQERDWGAAMVAWGIAEGLGIGGFYHVDIARALLDFGRFPGSTPPEAGYQDRYAINFPFSALLGHDQKRALLEEVYDRISNDLEASIDGALLKIAVHTYDPRNRSGTRRPMVSILTRSLTYDRTSRLNFNVFDPLYPDELLEFSCDRVLRDRLSLTLEKNRLHVAHNYPYLLHDGSLEVRSQVWFFFRYLRREFERAFPDTAYEPAYKQVWRTLLDTNLRSSTSEALRSYLHLYRRVPAEELPRYQEAHRAYCHIRDFLEADRRKVVHRYRVAPDRPSSLAIEVRKDLVWEFDSLGRPRAPRFDRAREIGRVIARAVAIYLREDHPGPEHLVALGPPPEG